MSINNVVLRENYDELLGKSHEPPFVTSSDGTEVLKYVSPTSRQTLSVQLKLIPNDVGAGININTKDGYIYITTKRLIYITATQGDINTFLIDLTLTPRLQLSHELKSPWFGPNYWQFMFFSVSTPAIASDGFPKNQWFQGQIKFNEGGLFEFIEVFNRVLNDAVVNNHIDDELPAYSD